MVTDQRSVEAGSQNILWRHQLDPLGDERARLWLDKAASTSVLVGNHQNNINAKLCGADALAFTLDARHQPSGPNSNDYKVIVLCD